MIPFLRKNQWGWASESADDSLLEENSVGRALESVDDSLLEENSVGDGIRERRKTFYQ